MSIKLYAGTYPCDSHKGWQRVCQLPAPVAEAWLCCLYADYLPTSRVGDRIPYLNKAYTVVQARWETVFAVYLHDGAWYLMRKEIEDLNKAEIGQLHHVEGS